MNITATSVNTATRPIPVNRSTPNEQAELSSSLPTPPFHKTNPQFWPSPSPSATSTTTNVTTIRDQVDRRSQISDASVTLEDLDHFVFESNATPTSCTRPIENDLLLDMNDFILYDYDHEPIPSSTYLFPPL